MPEPIHAGIGVNGEQNIIRSKRNYLSCRKLPKVKNRITAAFFLIMANLILFVHAVVPHHHHESELCFDTFRNTEKTTDYCCETKESKHQHESDKDEDGCFLSHIVALSSGEIRQPIRVDLSVHNLNHTGFELAALCSENSAVSTPGYFIEIVSHDHKPNYFSLACKASGLRAPPFSS